MLDKIIDLYIEKLVAVTTPVYTCGRWWIEYTEPYLPIGKLETYKIKESK